MDGIGLALAPPLPFIPAPPPASGAALVGGADAGAEPPPALPPAGAVGGAPDTRLVVLREADAFRDGIDSRRVSDWIDGLRRMPCAPASRVRRKRPNPAPADDWRRCSGVGEPRAASVCAPATAAAP